MIKRSYLIVIGSVVIIGTVIMGIFILSLQPTFKIPINPINPTEMGMEEWLEDFNSFYEFVKDNYPYIDVKNRTHGYNWLDQRERFEERIKNANDNTDFFNVIAAAVTALQNRLHTYVISPTQVINNKNEFKNWDPFNEIFSEEVTNSANAWSSIYDQYYADTYDTKYDVMIVYEKGEYVIYDYNTTWELLYGNKTIVTHINGVLIDDAIKTAYDRGYIDYDFKRNKNYVWSIYPRYFGNDAVFTIKNSTGYQTDVKFGITSGSAWTPYQYPSSLVNTTIFPNQSVGYLYVGVFVEDKLEQYISDVDAFYQQLKDVDNLIIDIRGNTGGFYSVWIENIVQPLIKEDYRHEQFFAYKSGKYVNYLHKQWLSKMDKVPKDQFDYLPPEVLTDEYQIYLNYMTYKPTPFMGSTNVEFNGNVTLLVDNVVYSAAEAFVNFCKESGFAKIYGTASGGDGIMLFPQYFVFPNSKLVVALTPAIGLDNTGQANEEVRTQPDVYYESNYGNFDELINYVINHL